MFADVQLDRVFGPVDKFGGVDECLTVDVEGRCRFGGAPGGGEIELDGGLSGVIGVFHRGLRAGGRVGSRWLLGVRSGGEGLVDDTVDVRLLLG